MCGWLCLGTFVLELRLPFSLLDFYSEVKLPEVCAEKMAPLSEGNIV